MKPEEVMFGAALGGASSRVNALWACLPLATPAAWVCTQENRLGQKFCVDCVLTADLSLAGATDDLQHTVNYAQVYE